MNTPWPKVRLSEVLKRSPDTILPSPERDYREITVRLWGKGAVLRGVASGARLAGGRRFVSRPGQLILSRIDARNGAIALVTDELDGGLVSNDFPLFDLDRSKLEPGYLGWASKTARFVELCQQASEGTTNRVRLQEDRFLALEISLPPLAEQRRTVARIEELAAKIEEARALRLQAAEEAEVLVNAKLRTSYFSFVKRFESTPLHEIIIEAGYGTSEKCDYERHEGSVPVLRIPNVASERITLGDLKFARLSQRDRERLLLAKGDILVVRTNGSLDLVGRTAVVDELPEPTAFASYMIRLRVDNARITPEYGQRMLRHLRTDGQLVDFARTTAGQYNVSLGRLRSARIPIPPPCEQLRIVAELDALQEKVDSVKPLQTETAAELDALLPSILDKAFKGEL